MKTVSKLKIISECVISKVKALFENKYKDSDFSKSTFYLIHEILIFFFKMLSINTSSILYSIIHLFIHNLSFSYMDNLYIIYPFLYLLSLILYIKLKIFDFWLTS